MAEITGFCFKPRDWAGLRTEERAALSVAVLQCLRRLYGEQSRDKKQTPCIIQRVNTYTVESMSGFRFKLYVSVLHARYQWYSRSTVPFEIWKVVTLLTYLLTP
jgi:hypothetical protein